MRAESVIAGSGPGDTVLGELGPLGVAALTGARATAVRGGSGPGDPESITAGSSATVAGAGAAGRGVWPLAADRAIARGDCDGEGSDCREAGCAGRAGVGSSGIAGVRASTDRERVVEGRVAG